MELRQLEHFVAVADEASFTKAALRCHIVQSGLSASIRALEEELGARVFVRSSRHFALTPEGLALLPEARRALSAVRNGTQAVAAVQGLERGTLIIGAAKILPPPFDLVDLLHRFHVNHPGIQLRLRQDSSTELFRALRGGSLDLVIAGALVDEMEGVHQHVIAKSPLVLACARTHRLAHAKRVRLRDLADESFVDMSREWSTRLISEAEFQRVGAFRRVHFEVNDPSCLLALVERDLGVAIVPRMLERLKARVVFVPLVPALLKWELVAAQLAGEPPSAAAGAFIDLVIADAASVQA